MLDQKVQDLARGKNFAAVTTLGSDGTPMTHPMWIDTDGDHLLVNTEVHRQKFLNIQNDPRITVTVWDTQNPYSYAEVRGRVIDTITGPEAKDHIDRLAQKYMDVDEYPMEIQSERVIVKIGADRQIPR